MDTEIVSVKECCICERPFGGSDGPRRRRPYVIGCGHSVCRRCSRTAKNCPGCGRINQPAATSQPEKELRKPNYLVLVEVKWRQYVKEKLPNCSFFITRSARIFLACRSSNEFQFFFDAEKTMLDRATIKMKTQLKLVEGKWMISNATILFPNSPHNK